MKLIELLGILQDKIYTLLLSYKKGITVGASTIVYHKSRIDCSPISYKKGGGIYRE